MTSMQYNIGSLQHMNVAQADRHLACMQLMLYPTASRLVLSSLQHLQLSGRPSLLAACTLLEQVPPG